MRGTAAWFVSVVLLGGCTANDPTLDVPAAGPAAAAERITATLDGVALTLEVADEPAERAVGLMRRASIPPGTGMVFLYDAPVTERYYMFDVQVPLRAVFLRDGTVVSSVLMPPCTEPVASACPLYGADAPYDTVVETAPETLPDVAPGDRYTVTRSGS